MAKCRRKCLNSYFLRHFHYNIFFGTWNTKHMLWHLLYLRVVTKSLKHKFTAFNSEISCSRSYNVFLALIRLQQEGGFSCYRFYFSLSKFLYNKIVRIFTFTYHIYLSIYDSPSKTVYFWLFCFALISMKSDMSPKCHHHTQRTLF